MEHSPIANGGAFGTQQTLVQHETVQTYDPKDVSILELGLTGYQRVHRLMTVMGQGTPDAPCWPDEATFALRVKLDLEEFFEKIYKGYYLGNPLEILDGACDVEVVGVGSMVAFGVDYDLAIAEVDRSNLSKLGEDGKPILNDGVIAPDQPIGKFLKGPNYTPPNLVQFLHGLESIPAPYDTKRIVQEALQKVMFEFATKTDLLNFPLVNARPETVALGNAMVEAIADAQG